MNPSRAEGRASHFPVIVLLFVVMRLTMLFFYTPQGIFNAYTDYHHYYRTALLSEQGYFPFVNMWYEYPPLLAYLPQFAYKLTTSIMPAGDVFSFTYQVFARILGMILLVFETGVLMVTHRIALRVWGTERADWTGWVYSGLSLPLFYWSFSHQQVMVFFALLSLYWFIEQRWGSSAVALGLGVVAKLTPVFMIAPAVRFLWPRLRQVVTYGVLAGLTAAIGYAPFLVRGGAPWIAASFKAIANVGSWGTVWALLDGNWGPGDYGPLTTRLDLAEAGLLHNANPPVIPGIVVLAVFAIVYGLLYFRPIKRGDARHYVWFTTLTALIFHLWSKGWSPQWSVFIIPLFLLSFPGNRGLKYALALTGLVFAEWLLQTLGVRPLFALTILGRTLLFIWAAVRLVQLLNTDPVAIRSQ